MSKKTGSEGFFDDGLTYLFTNEDGSLAAQRPKHIHFEVRTTTADVETCDFRFYSVEKVVEAEDDEEGRRLSLTEGQDQQNHDQSQKATSFSSKPTVITASPTGPSKEFKKVEFSDVVFFRLGYFDFLKLNTQNMIMKFEEKTWYSVDLILNYDDQRVSIYVNDKPYKSASFFTQRKEKLDSGNAISIYGLSPGGVSQFRNVKVCETLCDEESLKEVVYTDLSGSISLQQGFSLLIGFSSILVSLLA